MGRQNCAKITKKEHIKVEDWAEKIFIELLFNLVNPFEKKHVYSCVGLDHKWVDREFHKYIDQGEVIKDEMKNQNNIFRVLVKTLLKAHIITDRTRATYAEFVNMDELNSESDTVAGQEIADQGVSALSEINQLKKSA